MTTLREAAQRALEALEYLHTETSEEEDRFIHAAITTLRAALAQEDEPVAWMVYTLDGKSVCVTDNPDDFTDQHKALPLYTTPPQRKPLTDNQIAEIYVKWDATPGVSLAEFARAIERAHGIGGDDGQV